MADEPSPQRPSGGDWGDFVVCSLEPWDNLWRRNQFLVRELLAMNQKSRALFIEPAVDVTFELVQRRRPGPSGLRQVTPDGRLWAMRPRKVLPRLVAGSAVARHLAASAVAAVAKADLDRPLLWVNDVSYAPLAQGVDWPVVYDITDDWLQVGGPRRGMGRLAALEAALLERAEEVVVVSPALAKTRTAHRPVHLIANAVDVDHFSVKRSRPADLPPGAVALYVGTQHEARLDIELCAATARLIAPAKLVLVGQNSLSREASRLLSQAGCLLLGPRPYHEVPAYYQHADVIVVPHPLNPFTESLDPIKGYECQAVGRPTVVTPVAGLRELGPPIEVCDRAEFPERVRAALVAGLPSEPGCPPTWRERAEAFATVMRSARAKRDAAPQGPPSAVEAPAGDSFKEPR